MESHELTYAQPQRDGPAGIGGWLILPFLGLVVSPFVVALTMARDVVPAFESGTWAALTTPGSPAYHAMWGPYLVGVALLNSALALAAIALLVVGFQKRLFFPRLMVAFYAFVAAVAFVDVAAVNGFLQEALPEEAAKLRPEAYAAFLKSLLAGGLWSTYFLVSKRVRNTFIG